MVAFIRRIFCRHAMRPLRYFYGDDINHTGCRAYIKCRKCGTIHRARLF
jgi:RNase P subunit RPR2